MIQLTRDSIILAEINGVLEKFRRDVIEERISQKYTEGQEFRLYIERDSEPEPWLEHENYVAQIKNEIDSAIEAALTNK
jgi:hypothetical protein